MRWCSTGVFSDGCDNAKLLSSLCRKLPNLTVQVEFFEKGKAPPTLKNNRELGLFFMEGQLLCDQRSNGGCAGYQLLDIATQRKPTQIFSTIFIASR